MKKGCPPDPYPKTFNDFSALGDKHPTLKSVRECRKERLKIIFSAEFAQQFAICFIVSATKQLYRANALYSCFFDEKEVYVMLLVANDEINYAEAELNGDTEA